MPEFILLQVDRTSPQTLKVLEDRESVALEEPKFFSKVDFELLEELAACVLPQSQVGTRVPVALHIDNRLWRREGSGWRYETLPIETEAYPKALYILRNHISASGEGPTAEKPDGLLQLLEAVQRKEYDTTTFALSRWLENFKTELARYWLADPQVMALLRYEGFADELLTPQAAGSI